VSFGSCCKSSEVLSPLQVNISPDVRLFQTFKAAGLSRIGCHETRLLSLTLRQPLMEFLVCSVLNILSGSSQTSSVPPPDSQSQEEETGQREGAIPFTLLSKKGNKQQVIFFNIFQYQMALAFFSVKIITVHVHVESAV
jgi:hypothetical protein